jgi:hypothetical protein
MFIDKGLVKRIIDNIDSILEFGKNFIVATNTDYFMDIGSFYKISIFINF